MGIVFQTILFKKSSQWIVNISKLEQALPFHVQQHDTSQQTKKHTMNGLNNGKHFGHGKNLINLKLIISGSFFSVVPFFFTAKGRRKKQCVFSDCFDAWCWYVRWREPFYSIFICSGLDIKWAPGTHHLYRDNEDEATIGNKMSDRIKFSVKIIH